MKRDFSKETLWQVGSGDGSRNYAKYFFDYGVALVGPGNPGRHGDPDTERFYQDNPGVNNWGAELAKINLGDWIIIRKGRKQILGIGEVIGEYQYSTMFEDVEGWDLQHYRKVKWYQPEIPIEFKKSHLVMDTLARCHHQKVVDRLAETTFKEVEPSDEVMSSEHLPTKLTPEELTPKLIDSGVRIGDAENITHTIRRVIQLAKWYYQNDFHASEHELRTFLVVPFLFSLGWPEQKIKIELKKIDITLFDQPYRASQEDKLSPKMIIETKNYDNGLAFTKKQVAAYGKKFENCKWFVTTNGFRYRLYRKENGELIPKGYLNLLNMREQNLLYREEGGAYQTLLQLSNLKIS